MFRHFFICFLVSSCAFYSSSNAQSANNVSSNKISVFSIADSFYYDKNWGKAKDAYRLVLRDTSKNALEWNRLGFCYYNTGDVDAAMKAYQRSLDLNPSGFLKQTVMARMARVYARTKKYDEAISSLESAMQNGYSNVDDLDSLDEFKAIRTNEKFMQIRKKAFDIAYPCASEPKSTDFDFWIGEWMVYITGTHILAGHSWIQRAAGGCMILENWSSAMNAYNGKSINFYDPQKNKWEQIWVGSEGGPDRVHRFYNGEYRDSAMHFDFKSANEKGEPLTGRFTFFNQGKNQVRQLQESSGDNGNTWRVVYDFTYLRVK